MQQIFQVRVLMFLALLFIGNALTGQVYLYLEDMMQVSAIKIPEGASISAKTIDEPKWTSYRIEKLYPDDNIIIHANGMLDLANITHLRIQRRWVVALGTAMQTFGAAWGVYGLVILAANPSVVQLSGIAIGAIVPWTAGFIMKKIWKYKRYKINSKTRLKILDLSFPEDPYGVKEKKVKYTP